MKVSRWALTVLSGAALVLFSTSAPSVAEPDGNASGRPAAPVPAAPGVAPADPGPTVPAAPAPAVPTAPGGAAPDAPAPQPTTEPVPGAGLCRAGTPPNAPATTEYHDGNVRLGPAVLPTASPVGPLLTGYQRFGGLTGDAWAADFLNDDRTVLRYPPSSGYVLGPDGRPVKTTQTLLPGYRLDRFGSPGGGFLSPLGTPYSSRALPPLNLTTPENAPLANYHVYCVLKPFAVDTGPVAPWFAQPGMGTQFQLNPAYLPEAGGTLTITWLLKHRFLVEEDLTAAADLPCVPRAVPQQQNRSATTAPVC
ncbi:TNT domain-containing protein [Micromonospora fluostatini]|uniref:TNT domain-containing protein n=1 Tax=Micromonospora sp. JCM 30529 TaxID=3421643 RepID=UPI003D17F859